MPLQSIRQSSEDLGLRLRARRPEIEQAVMTRVFAVSGSSPVLDSEYIEGLRAAVNGAIDYGLAAVELGEERSPPPPPVLLGQARLAARKGISLDIVLRRYFAGHTLITDFLIEETENVGTFSSVKTQRLLQSQATLFDRLMAAVSEEYAEEAKRNSRSPGRRRSEQVERLLKGELVDTSELAYDFEGHHLGAIARAPAAAESLREISRSLGCRVLLVAPDEETAWAWLGSRHPKDLEELEQLISSTWTEHAVVALGDPAESLAGWRFTHRQARAALPIAVSSSKGVVRYADVALLASIVQDELLVTSLHRLYLAPLKTDGDGGKMLCQTLRAYFAAERKVSSAAAALGVNRHTVANRLAAIESRLTRPLSSCAAELEVALRLEELGDAVCDPPLSQNADLVQLDLKRRR